MQNSSSLSYPRYDTLLGLHDYLLGAKPQAGAEEVLRQGFGPPEHVTTEGSPEDIKTLCSPLHPFRYVLNDIFVIHPLYAC